MKKIIILSSVLLIAIAVIAVKYFSELSGNNNNSTKVLKYIPSDAALVISFNNDTSFYDIFRNYEPFNAIMGESRAAELKQVHSQLLQEPAIRELSDGQRIFLSFHPQKRDSVEFLFTLALTKKPSEEELEEKLRSVKEVTFKRLPEGSVSLSFSTIGRPLYFSESEGVIVASFSKELLENAVKRSSAKISSEFIEEINEGNTKNLSSPVNLFVNHDALLNFFTRFSRSKASGNALLLKDMKGFSSLSMNFKSDALMFNGLSTPDTSGLSYLNLFLKQRPVKNQIKTLLPENTASSLIFGVSDYKQFHSDLKYYLHKKGDLKKLLNQISFVQSEAAINLHDDVERKFSNEFGVFETSEREKYGIIKVLNGADMDLSLRVISQKATANISRFNNSNLLYYFFGEPFKDLTRPYFAIIDNYLIIANSISTVQRYLDHYNNNRFISKTKGYNEHDQFVANQSNILFFINLNNAEQSLARWLKKRYSDAFTADNYGLKNFYGLSLQWSSDGSHFQTNLYSNYTPDEKRELKEVWKFKMNTRIAIAPQLIRLGGEHTIFVQDNVNNLYALSDKGEKLWATQLDGTIKGKILLLRDSSLMFNTTRKLYRISLKGYNFNNFPVDLPSGALAGFTSTGDDTDSVKLFIPVKRRILAYNSSGQELEGWNHELNENIAGAIQAATVATTRYLIAGTETGTFFFFNQNGKLITRVGAVKEKTMFKSRFFVNAGANTSSSEIVTTDTAGLVYRISFEGKVRKDSVTRVSAEHDFEFKNVTGDERQELIFLDKNQLNVYNQDGTLVFTYTFDSEGSKDIRTFSADRTKYQLGVSSDENQLLYLFNEDGNQTKGFPVKGIGDFFIGYLKNDGIPYIIYGSKDANLHVYKL